MTDGGSFPATDKSAMEEPRPHIPVSSSAQIPRTPPIPGVPRDADGTIRLGALLDAAAKALANSGSETPRLDALLLLESVLKRGNRVPPDFGRAQISAHPEIIIEENDAQIFLGMLVERANGIPVAYLTGSKFFWKHEFAVTRDVLIPKPDTEILVERTEAVLAALSASRTESDGALCLLDACTGSGCVAISLKADFPAVRVAALDISAKALAVAKKNAARILPAQDKPETECGVVFFRQDLRDGLPAPAFTRTNGGCKQKPDSAQPAHTPRTEAQGWNVIVANPPYVPTKTVRELLADGRGEPALALDGGADGLSLIGPLVRGAAQTLAPGGFLLTETGEYNADAAAEYFQTCGFVDIVISTDLAGLKRVVEGRLG